MAKAPSSKSAFLLDVDLRFQYLRFQCVLARFRKSAFPTRPRFFHNLGSCIYAEECQAVDATSHSRGSDILPGFVAISGLGAQGSTSGPHPFANVQRTAGELSKLADKVQSVPGAPVTTRRSSHAGKRPARYSTEPCWLQNSHPEMIHDDVL